MNSEFPRSFFLVIETIDVHHVADDDQMENSHYPTTLKNGQQSLYREL